MQIDPTSSTSTTAPASSGALQGTKDEFLKLFMAQLEHQDPLSPKDGADMVAQLAQFSAVEQAQQTNQQLSDLAAAQSSQSSASLSNLVGRTVGVNLNSFTIDKPGSVPPPIDVSATGPMKGASVVITDSNGKELRRMPIADGSNESIVQWDGKDASGNTLAAGSYKISVDPGTTTASISSHWQGRIDAVELTSNGPRLRMGGILFAPGDVTTIGGTL